jgi:type II secretory pathway pseudopilin PulG
MNNQMTEPEGKGKFSMLWTVLIVLFILLIFAAIAIPDFLTFQAKAKCSELKQNLGAIYTTQVAYFSEYGNYADGDDCFGHLDWRAEGTRYSYYCGKDKIACTVCNTQCPDPDLVDFQEGSFTLFAVGNIDNDETCDVWSINDAKELINIKSDLDD